MSCIRGSQHLLVLVERKTLYGIAVRLDSKPAIHTIETLKKIMMRSRPDIIVLGEISTSNSLPILRFLNSGHAGFFTTVHANTPDLALGAAIPQNVRLSGQDDTGVEEVLRSTVDLVIQLNKHNGKRSVTEILFPKEGRRITTFEIQSHLQAA